MSDQLVHGFYEAELDALRIGNHERTECLKHLVPLRRCLIESSVISVLLNNTGCDDLKRDFYHCKEPLLMRDTGYGAMLLKKNARVKFDEEKVAPSLAENYRPTFLATVLH